MTRAIVSRHLAFALAGMLALAGCSNLPTKPAGLGSPDAGAAVTSGGTSSEILGLPTTTTTTSTLSATTTRTIIGLLGGVVSAGDFSVVIPPGAIMGTAAVTVTQPDRLHPVVQLSIAPLSANKFQLPVLLVANARTMSPSLLSVAYLSYFNPATGQWERVSGSSVSLLNLTVTAPLWHFSTYRVESGGKAGW
jgi:hypothetical protein